MEPSEQTTITDHSSELLEASNPSEVLELEDDLTAILRAKDATIKIKSAENHIQASMLKQKDEAIAKLKEGLEKAERRLDAIQMFTHTAYFMSFTEEQVDGIFHLLQKFSDQAAFRCRETLQLVSSTSDENSTPNREG